ncbi:phosphodiesterase [Streptomyces sp. DH12]|uniref:phosphodiesterase n=1 Tax=Streptomyces sp. DH12 TaxID=2857010 RepID=UPI001E603FF5|nr:phosphodiesterase [Streptomyces sp. DH12]
MRRLTAPPAARDAAAAATHRLARTAARSVARLRRAPALHPDGVNCSALLSVPGSPHRAWGVPLLDDPGTYEVTARWSRALGLPQSLPDGFGLALRVEDAGGPGQPWDLLLTTSGRGRVLRHVPLPRYRPLAGPYGSLTAYRVGPRTCWFAAVPRDPHHAVRGGLPALRRHLLRTDVVLDLCVAARGQPWRPVGVLVLTPRLPWTGTSLGYDPYRHTAPGLRPSARLGPLRQAAYAGSRAGRGQDG